MTSSGRYKFDDPVDPFDDAVNPLMRWNDALRFLDELEQSLLSAADPEWWSVSYYFSSTGRLEPRVVYLQRILSLWTLFGGRLKISNNADAITGPLARFLTAVTGPVMGNDAPKPASYRKLIQRQKACYRKIVENERKLDPMGMSE